jgi:acetyl esterase/lipase
MRTLHRRGFLLSGAAAVLAPGAAGQPAAHVYKTVDALEIQADIFGTPATGRKPVTVWIHGGALIMGSRRLAPNARFLRSLLDAGFAVISIDYRLAPETKLPGIIEDVRDAFRWIREKSATLHVDPDRLAVCGASAGGYLTLMTGFCLDRPPKALVSYWGYGDIAGTWYSRPDPFYLRQPKVTTEEAQGAVGKAPVSEPPPGNSRGRFYLYCRQQGTWPKEVAGHDPDTEDRWFDRYCPVRNVARSYPPTMLVHGTADTDVPYQQSKIMAARLAKAGVEHQLVTVPEGAHGIGNIAPEEQDRIYREAAAFLMKRVA